MATRIKLRRDTAANWLEQNPILANGETGFETDTRMMKLGDGATKWADLKYAVTGDLQVTDSTVHGDAGVSLSSGIGNRENWILLTNANDGDPSLVTSAVSDGVAYDSQGNAISMYWYDDPGGGASIQKITPSGEVIFSNYYNQYSSYGFGLEVDKDDNIILILGEYDGIAGNNDIILLKLKGDDGSIMWQRTITSYGDGNDFATCIDTDANGDIFIVGSVPGDGDDCYVGKFSGRNGNPIWQKRYDIEGFDDSGTGVCVDKDGNLGVVGSTLFMGSFAPVFKINGETGAFIWQAKVLRYSEDSGNDTYEVVGSDIATDSNGDFYVSINGWTGGGPFSNCILTKINGSTGVAQWAQQIGYSDWWTGVGSVATDDQNNVYVSSTLRKYSQDYNFDSANRATQQITKFNSTGSVIWQRWLSKQQYENNDSSTRGLYNGFPAGYNAQSVAVRGDYVLLNGTGYYVYRYGDSAYYGGSQVWANQPYVAQLSRDGTEFEIDGWSFKDSGLPVKFVTVWQDPINWTFDPATAHNANVDVVYGDASYQANSDQTDLAYLNVSRVNKVTFEEKTLTLPSGGTINVSREKTGYITAIGSFDGNEGGNTQGAVWLNGSDRDEKGATYAAGGWYTYNTWNDWHSYENIPMVFKTDADGKLIWQAGNALDQNDGGYADLVDVAYHQPTNTVVALGNDGVLDGAEGFNILYLDADSGAMKQDITHIRPSDFEQNNNEDIYPTALRLMSDGTPVVGGYINTAYDEFDNVTDGYAAYDYEVGTQFTNSGAPTTPGIWLTGNGTTVTLTANRTAWTDTAAFDHLVGTPNGQKGSLVLDTYGWADYTMTSAWTHTGDVYTATITGVDIVNYFINSTGEYIDRIQGYGGAPGLAGSANGFLVFPRSKFVREGKTTEYPTDDGYWYIYPDASSVYKVNSFGYDESSPVNTYTGTLGSGATFDINVSTVDAVTTVTVTLVSGGTGYKAGQRVKVLGSNTGGGDDIYIYIDTVDAGTITGITNDYDYGATVDGTYSAVASTALAGSGFDCWVSYANGEDYAITINNYGTYYGVGDTIKILGTQLGGATPANDLTITISAISGTGRNQGVISDVSLSGTPQTTNIRLYAGSADYTQNGIYNIVHELGRDSFVWTPNWSFSAGGKVSDSYDKVFALEVDSSDNVIVGGYCGDTGLVGTDNNNQYGQQRGFVAKFDGMTGEKLWSTSIDGSEGESTVWSAAVDSQDNIYSVMTTNIGHRWRVTKQNSAGEFQWSTGFQFGYSTETVSIAVTDNDEVLLVGEVYDDQFNTDYRFHNNNLVVIKIDKDGNHLFARSIWSRQGVRMNDNDYYSGQLTVKGDRFSVVAYSQDPGWNNNNGIVIDLPVDGTGLGNYGDFVYDTFEVEPHYRYTQNHIYNSIYNVTPFDLAVRPHGFVSQPYVDGDQWRNVTIYGDRTAQVQTGYKPEGGSVEGVAKIVFEDGSEQTTSAQGLPQVRKSATSGAEDYWLRPEDNGKHIWMQSDGYTVIIPSRNRVDLPVGFAFTIITDYWSNGVWSEDYDETIYLSGGGGTNDDSWEIPQYTMATLVKIDSGRWMIAGAGLTPNWW